jgi:hypothetical protein
MMAELAYIIDGYEKPDSSVRLWLLVVPTVALVGLAVTALVLSRREVADVGTEVVGPTAARSPIAGTRPGSPALDSQLGHGRTVAARHHPARVTRRTPARVTIDS